MPKAKTFSSPPSSYTFNNANFMGKKEIALLPENKSNLDLPELQKKALQEDFIWFTAKKLKEDIWKVNTNDEDFEISGTRLQVQKKLSCYAYREMKKKELFDNEDINLNDIPQIADNTLLDCAKQFKLKSKYADMLL